MTREVRVEGHLRKVKGRTAKVCLNYLHNKLGYTYEKIAEIVQEKPDAIRVCLGREGFRTEQKNTIINNLSINENEIEEECPKINV